MRRRLIGLSMLPLVVLLGATSLGGRAQNDPASRAIRYLSSQQRPDGSVDGAPGETEDFVLGAAAAGFDPAGLRSAAGRSAVDFLAAHFTAALASGAPDAGAGPTAKLILAVRAAHLDPAAFRGQNLVVHLGTFITTGGTYGDGRTFTQALAILAMRSVGLAPPRAAIARLLALENPDGSWSFDGTRGARGDTNSTAVAAQALAVVGNHDRDAAEIAYLHAQQNLDGGFPYQKPNPLGTGSDPSSDAIVVEALASLHQDPAGAAWSTAAGAGPLRHLISAQDPATGGLTFPGRPGPDSFTTSTAAQAIALQPLPVRAGFEPGSGLAEQTAAGEHALQFLAHRQGPDGAFSEDAGVTEDVVMGTAAAGYDPGTLRSSTGASALGYLAANVPVGSTGKLAKLALAVHAAGLDPASFGGHDLISEVRAAYDPIHGSFGDGSTFGQSLSILALAAAGGPVPQAAVARLSRLEGADGGWSSTNQARSPAGDTNSTAVAVMALAAIGVDHRALQPALSFLHRAQKAVDGGFGYDRLSPSDPDSDALVIQALIAAGQDPASARWTIGGRTPLTSLLGMQEPLSGGYSFGTTALPDVFTTSQVPAGIERVPFPVPPRFVRGRAIPAVASMPVPPPPVASPAAPPLPPSAAGGPAAVAPTRQPTILGRVAAATPAPAAAAAGTITTSGGASPSPVAPRRTLKPDGTPGPAVIGAVQGATTGPASRPSAASGTPGVGAPWWLYLLAALLGFTVVGGTAWRLMPRPARSAHR